MFIEFYFWNELIGISGYKAVDYMTPQCLVVVVVVVVDSLKMVKFKIEHWTKIENWNFQLK